MALALYKYINTINEHFHDCDVEREVLFSDAFIYTPHSKNEPFNRANYDNFLMAQKTSGEMFFYFEFSHFTEKFVNGWLHRPLKLWEHIKFVLNSYYPNSYNIPIGTKVLSNFPENHKYKQLNTYHLKFIHATKQFEIMDGRGI